MGYLLTAAPVKYSRRSSAYHIAGVSLSLDVGYLLMAARSTPRSHHVLAIVNSAAVNNGIRVSFSMLVSSGNMPRSGIAGSYGGFIPTF